MGTKIAIDLSKLDEFACFLAALKFLPHILHLKHQF
jgi:hypothetical protein